MAANHVRFALLIIVVMVWGVILFRVKDGLNQAEIEDAPSSANYQPVHIVKDDTIGFKLLLSYGDVFGISSHGFSHQHQSTSHNAPAKYNHQQKDFTLRYRGLVTAKNTLIGLVTDEDGRFIHVRRFEKINGFTVTQINEDSIVLSSGKTVFSIKKMK